MADPSTIRLAYRAQIRAGGRQVSAESISHVMNDLLPTPLVLDRGGAVARQRSLSKTWLLSTDFSWSALSTSCRFAVERPAYKRADNGSDLFSPLGKKIFACGRPIRATTGAA